jgi:hypothetical protein
VNSVVPLNQSVPAILPRRLQNVLPSPEQLDDGEGETVEVIRVDAALLLQEIFQALWYIDAHMTKMLPKSTGNVRIPAEVSKGKAAEEIVAFAEREFVDLVVMGWQRA